MRARISTHIVLDLEEVPAELCADVVRVLTIPNPRKARALSEHVPGAEHFPDLIELYEQTPAHELKLPRGFAHEFERLCREHCIPLEWESAMTLYQPADHRFLGWPELSLRGYQAQARDELLEWANGIMMAPTASGKTRVALEVARTSGQPTLVIVDRTALARQWQTAVQEAYGQEPGMIGDGRWDVKRDITIALRQSLWARRDEIVSTFWGFWGMIVLDEVHHAATAETLGELIQRFPAFFRLGYSATPVWDKQFFPVLEALVGPIVHRTQAADTNPVLVKPEIITVKTAFEFAFTRTQMAGYRRVQNNYTEMMAALIEDGERNATIARIAVSEAQAGHHVLITTRRLEHVGKLSELIEDQGVPVFLLTGKQSRLYESTRQQIAEIEGGSVLISTIADEALDIPRLDRLIMAFPARRVRLVEQQIGRITRQSPGKLDAIVYDLYDEKIGVMKGQHRDRMQELYLRRRWSIAVRETVLS